MTRTISGRHQNDGVDIVVSDVPAAAAAARIAFRLRDAVRRRGTASLALSGGTSTPPMIDALVRSDVPWRSVGIWQVDERVAPDGHVDRNARQLEPLAGVAGAVHAMPVMAPDLPVAAARYGTGLPEQFDVIHLGVGTDGHTASWPPDEPAVPSSPAPVELVPMFNGRPRMTLTRRIVNGARCRVVLAVGGAKRPVIERWLLGDPALPITAVRRTGTTTFLDEAAAPLATLC
jgi:6-phosphogluconolactonase/glucosamine-6-phosphate isomerase/deaminase